MSEINGISEISEINVITGSSKINEISEITGINWIIVKVARGMDLATIPILMESAGLAGLSEVMK